MWNWMIFLLILLAVVMVFFVAKRRKKIERICSEILNEAEMLMESGKMEDANKILNDIRISSRYDSLGEKANFLSARCLEKLGRNLEASYEYVTYLAKFPHGLYFDQSKERFKSLWSKFGPFDYQRLKMEDACGFVTVEKVLRGLTLELNKHEHKPLK